MLRFYNQQLVARAPAQCFLDDILRSMQKRLGQCSKTLCVGTGEQAGRRWTFDLMCSLSQAGMVRCSGRSVGAEGPCVMAAASLTPRSSISTPLAKLCAQEEYQIKPVPFLLSAL